MKIRRKEVPNKKQSRCKASLDKIVSESLAKGACSPLSPVSGWRWGLVYKYALKEFGQCVFINLQWDFTKSLLVCLRITGSTAGVG